MHCLMATRAPATATLQKRGMVPPADQNDIGRGLLLEVAFEAEVLVPLNEHLVVYGPMRIVAGGAAFANGLMLEDKRASLCDVAFGTGFVLGSHREWSSDRCRTFMRIMTIAATHLPMHYRMRVRQVKTALHLQVTVEADLRRPVRIDNSVARTAALRVQAARPVAALASDIRRVHSMRLQPGMGRSRKMLVDVRVALSA